MVCWHWLEFRIKEVTNLPSLLHKEYLSSIRFYDLKKGGRMYTRDGSKSRNFLSRKSKKVKDIDYTSQEKVFNFLQNFLADDDCLASLALTLFNKKEWAVDFEIPINKHGKVSKKLLKKYSLLLIAANENLPDLGPEVIYLTQRREKTIAFQSGQQNLSIELFLTEEEKQALVSHKEKNNKTLTAAIVSQYLQGLSKKKFKQWIEKCCKALLEIDIESQQLQKILAEIYKTVAQEENFFQLKDSFIHLILRERRGYAQRIQETKEKIAINRNLITEKLSCFDGLFMNYDNNDDELRIIAKGIEYLSQDPTPGVFQFLLGLLKAYAISIKENNWNSDRNALESIVVLQTAIIGWFTDQNAGEYLERLRSAPFKQTNQALTALRYLAMAWSQQFMHHQQEAKEVLQSFIAICLNPIKESPFDFMHGITDFARFLKNITGLSKEQEQEIASMLIAQMGDFVFPLIDAHFQQEEGPPGRDNSLVSGVIAQLIANNESCLNYVVHCLQPLLKVIEGMDLAVFQESFAKNLKYIALNQAFLQVMESLFTIKQHPPMSQRIIQGFLSRSGNNEKLLGYFLIRFINPLIIQHGQAQHEISPDWYGQFIVFVFQALGAAQAKKSSYQQKMPSSLLDIVYDENLRTSITKKLLTFAPISDSNLESPFRWLDLTPSAIRKSIFLNHKSAFLPIEEKFLRLCKDTGFEKQFLAYKAQSIDERIRQFEKIMKELKSLFKKGQAAKQRSWDHISDLKKRLTWILFALINMETERLEIAEASERVLSTAHKDEFSALIMEAMGKAYSLQKDDPELISYLAGLEADLLPGMDKKLLLVNQINLYCGGILNLFIANATENAVHIAHNVTDEHFSRLDELTTMFKAFYKDYAHLAKRRSSLKSDVKALSTIGLLSSSTNSELSPQQTTESLSFQ